MWDPPDALLIYGIPYRLRTDFRAGIEYATAAASGDLDAAAVFSIWFEPEDMPPAEYAMEAFEGINRFYLRKDEPKVEKPEDKDQEEDGSGSLPWDFTEDADAIQADFQSVYHIDLSSVEMHWWRFMALLEGIYSYTFRDRVRFRCQSFDGMDARQRKHAQKMRAKFAIYRGEDGRSYDDSIAYLDSIIDRYNSGNTD